MRYIVWNSLRGDHRSSGIGSSEDITNTRCPRSRAYGTSMPWLTTGRWTFAW